MLLLVPLVLALYLWAAAPERGMASAVLGGIGAGILLFAATAMKVVALPAVLGFCAVHLLLAREVGFTRRGLVLGGLIVGLLPGIALLSHRVTEANSGRRFLVSNKGAADFLLGHYGRIAGIRWHNPRDGTMFEFGSPSAFQRGYTEVRDVPFAMTDVDKNASAAWQWIRQHPGEALVLSLEHVYDTFLGSFPWPSASADDVWKLTEGFHFAYVGLLLLPALLRCYDVMRAEGVRGFLRSREFLILSPLIGVLAAVFVATGEARYRIPFDCCIILVAIQFYRSLSIRVTSPAPARTPP
jgi:hypothetical protein